MPDVAQRTRRPLIIAGSLLLVAAAAVLGAVRWVDAMLQPPNPEATAPVAVEIPSGASMSAVADILYEKQLVRHPVVFRYYARYQKQDVNVKPGSYQLLPSMTPDQILEKLAKGVIVVHRFTIPEGLTVEQVGDLLAAEGIVDKAAFMQAAGNAQLAAAYLPADVELEYPLEGYLFPDTYDYKPGVSAEELVGLMFQRWEAIFTPELRQRAEELGMTVHQVMTLASIVEEEAQVAGERATIAGVYHNRLNIGMKLDADPTVSYALKKQPGDVLKGSELGIESPYNTYLVPGLPPGPISSPGEAAIRAALYPESHDFWFFVAKGDGSGEHYFATTLDEQNVNIIKAAENEQ